MPDQLPYFFFSYARADAADEPNLTRFYTDLRTEIRSLTGRPPITELGFFDARSIHIGTTWSAELVNALSHCRTFVALCSPSYVNSEYCAREWGAFADRARRLEAATGRAFAKLVPVMWIPVSNPPPAMAEVQYDNFELGELYSKYGVRRLLRLKRNADDYQEFLEALARRIVTMAHEDKLPPDSEMLPFEDAPDVFGTRFSLADLASGPLLDPGNPPAAPDGGAATPDDAPQPGLDGPADRPPADGIDPDPPTTVPPTAGPPTAVPPTESRAADRHPTSASRRTTGGGPRFVTFVIAATGIDELPDTRRHRIYYGPHYRDWAPYQPQHSHGLCAAIQEVAGRQGMTSTVAQLEQGVGALLDRARAGNEIVIVVVDIWATGMERFIEPFAEYDRSNEPTTGVLVPWDAADQETIARQEDLMMSFRAAFSRTMLRQDGLVQMDVQSYENLCTALSRALARLQAKIIETSEPFRDRSGPSRPPPTIEGP